MLTEFLGARYKTRKAYRFPSNTAGVTVDFSDADGLGPADAVVVSIAGADRAITLQAAGDGDSVLWTIEDGRDPVFEIRTEEVAVAAGTSAHIEIIACYVDRWE